jgi:hypothetical protein
MLLSACNAAYSNFAQILEPAVTEELAWMARVLSDEQRATLVGKVLPEQELLPLRLARFAAPSG